MTEDDPGVPVHCEECGTTTRIPLSEVGDAVERHNDQLHGGEEVAGIDPDLADELANLVAEDMGLLDGE